MSSPKEILEQFYREDRDELTAREYVDTLAAVSAGQVTWLDKENAQRLYPWYVMGRTFREIGEMASFPEAIIVMTSIRYQWKLKKAEFLDSKTPIEGSTQDLVQNVFLLTQMAVKEEVKKVLDGKVSAADSMYVPKTPAALKDFLGLVYAVNNMQDLLEKKTIQPAPIQNNILVQSSQPQKLMPPDPIEQINQLKALEKK